jgi:hypothetical protein
VLCSAKEQADKLEELIEGFTGTCVFSVGINQNSDQTNGHINGVGIEETFCPCLLNLPLPTYYLLVVSYTDCKTPVNHVKAVFGCHHIIRERVCWQIKQVCSVI